jgi:tRNA G46 methylase TrmB
LIISSGKSHTRQNLDCRLKIHEGVKGCKQTREQYSEWRYNQEPIVAHDSHILFIPTSGKFLYERREEIEQQCKQFSFKNWIGMDNKLHVEICSGFGHWLVNKSHLEEGKLIGIEIKYKRATATLTRILSDPTAKEKCRVICSEAQFAFQNVIPDQSIDCCYINFPEPWSDKKKVFFNLAFVVTLSNKIKRGGKLFLVTDDPAYNAWCMQLMYETRELWDNDFEYPGYVLDKLEGYGEGAGFEGALREKGQSVHYLKYTRN